MLDEVYDVAIVGAGPAGLSAALVLGRCRERVLVLDDGQPRNQRSRAVHGYFTREGAPPSELRELGIAQLAPYAVRIESVHVDAVCHAERGFELSSKDRRWVARKLLLATGLQEDDADISGIMEHLGRGVYCCPYCDGWEQRDSSLGGLIVGPGAAEFALTLLSWSKRVTLFTHGVATVPNEERDWLAVQDVQVVETPIERIVGGEGERLRGVLLRDGSLCEVQALFLHAGNRQHSRLAESLGCEMLESDSIKTLGRQQTNVPGLYVAGDVAAHLNSVALAVADGYQAAVAIHCELQRERFLRPTRS
jgi:thioredoxin reductase